MPPRTSLAMHLLAILVVAVWGTTFVSTKVLLDAGLQPGDIFFIRFLIAYLCILPFSWGRLWAHNLRHELLLVLAGITGGSLYFLTENIALTHSYCSNVSLIVCSTPVITAVLLGCCYQGERINRRQLLCSMAALGGMALVVFNGSFVLHLSPVGDLLALAAAVVWALYSMVIRVLNNRYPMLFVTRKIFFYGLLTILPLYAFVPLQTDVELLCSPRVVGNLLFLGIVASCMCYLAWNVVMVRIGVVRSSNYLYLNPVVTLVASHLVLDERITPLAVAGTVLALLGIAGVEYFKRAAP